MSDKHERSATALVHMRESAEEAISLLVGISHQEFSKNRLLQLACTRLVELVGEAATRVSNEDKAKWSKVPWPVVIGMRNRLIHAYDTIDVEILYQTIDKDLPALLNQLPKKG